MDIMKNTMIGKYDYDLHSKDSNIYALIGFFGHLLFFAVLKYVFGLKEYFVLRALIACLFLVFFFLPNDHWRKWQIIYYEAVLYFTFPFFFSLMMFANGDNTFWGVSYLFAIVIYTIFSGPINNLVAQITLIAIIPILTVAYEVPKELLFSYLGIYMVSMLGAGLIQLFKVRVAREYHKKKISNDVMVQRNEMVSSLLYISSELSMYDDLDQVFSIFVERFKPIMELAAMGLILCKGKDYEVIKYGIEGTSEGNKDYILSNIKTISETENLHFHSDHNEEEYTPWYVFNRSYTHINNEGAIRYNLVLILHGETLLDYQIGIFQIFLEQLSGNIRTRFMSKELELYSKTDALTKLFNRSAYNEAFNKLKYDYTGDNPFSIIFGDINGLKHINDVYGHTDGDLLIKTCATLIKDTLPEGVPAYRYGGDEIVILLKDTSIEKALEITDALDETFKNREILCTNENTGETKMEALAISFGTISSLDGPFDQLLDLADAKMRDKKDVYYKSTDTGRYR